MTSRRVAWPVVPPRWRTPLNILLLAITALGIVLNTILSTNALVPQPVDFSIFGTPGTKILLGEWSTIYREAGIQAGPIELAFWGVPALLGVHGVVGWSVFGIVTATLFAIALCAVAAWVLRPLSSRWSTTIALGATAIASLGFVVTRAVSSGHPAELVIPLLWVVTGQLARKGHPLAAAAVLASTTGWEVWGLLGAPALLLAPRIDARAVWRSALGGAVVLAALFVPFFLIGPMRMFAFSWPILPGTFAHILFPHEKNFAWPLRFAQGVLSVGAGAATAWTLRRRPDSIWLPLLVVCVIRLIFDPLLAGYYSLPPTVLVLIGAGIAIARRALLPLLLSIVMLNVLLDISLTLVTAAMLVLLTLAMVIVVIVRERRTEALSIPDRLSK
jgi:hypothetical protein